MIDDEWSDKHLICGACNIGMVSWQKQDIVRIANKHGEFRAVARALVCDSCSEYFGTVLCPYENYKEEVVSSGS